LAAGICPAQGDANVRSRNVARRPGTGHAGPPDAGPIGSWAGSASARATTTAAGPESTGTQALELR